MYYSFVSGKNINERHMNKMKKISILKRINLENKTDKEQSTETKTALEIIHNGMKPFGKLTENWILRLL